MLKLTKHKAALLVSAFGAVTMSAVPLLASASTVNTGTRTYGANLSQLNSSGASGVARLTLSGRTLNFHLEAQGLEAGKVHPMHIHGKANPEIATCPTTSADINHDGFISVIEGAPSYGPIKLNLTSPQTPFGPPVTTALFSPFAGKANNANFPVADANGRESFDMTYTFDSSTAAEGAYQSLMPLENQHIVLHGGEAPASVDADAFAALGAPVSGDMTRVGFDALLPVACGQIRSLGSTANINATTAAVAQFQARLATLRATFEASRSVNIQAAVSAYIAGIQEARAQLELKLRAAGTGNASAQL